MASGQPFLDLLQWHPRDVDTLEEIYRLQREEEGLQRAREFANGGG